MTELNLDKLLDVAVSAAQQAGRLLLSYRGKVKGEAKGPGDVVTRADLESQALIRNQLLSAFPEHNFLGEEGPPDPQPEGTENRVLWLVDPLDGTANFLHGLDLFAVSIAAVLDHIPIVGVIHAPALHETYVAARGRGAQLNGASIRVSTVARLEDALLVTGFPPRPKRRPELLELYGQFCERSHAVRRLGSAALDLAYVAAGRFDGFYAVHLHAWDCAAGVLLVEEAGGKVTQLDGSPFDLFKPSLLATNGKIHSDMVRVAAQVLGFAPHLSSDQT